MEKLNRKFKGIWTPAEIWLDEKISFVEKFFLAEIDSLDFDGNGCFMSNKYFAKFFKLTEKHVSHIINALAKKKLIASKIDKKSGNRRLLKVTHPALNLTSLPIRKNTDTPYPQKCGYPIRKNTDTLSAKIPIGHFQETGKQCEYNASKGQNQKTDNNTNTNNINNINNTNINPGTVRAAKLGLKNSSEILELDLKIADQKKLLAEQLEKIFNPSKGELVTFARIIRHITAIVQNDFAKIHLFKDAIEWAQSAKASNAANKKGLFVAKVKQETGFSKSKLLLQGGKKYVPKNFTRGCDVVRLGGLLPPV
jgi:hypothetical protein